MILVPTVARTDIVVWVNVQAADPQHLVIDGHCIPRATQGRTALLLARVGGVLSEIADDRVAAAGLDGRDYTILAILDADGPGSQHELAFLLGKAPGIVVAAVDTLEERGLVARTRDPADRRRTIVTLTAAGRKTLKQADKVAEAAVADVLAGLDAGERRQLDALLFKGLGLEASSGS
jgi:DNA-binding MarR family transcriptional regulator